MKCVIIGAGLAGLAVAFYLQEAYPSAVITLYDAKGVGGGASGIAAGLLHPWPGRSGKLAPLALEGMHEALKLFRRIHMPLKWGIERFATNDRERRDFAQSPYRGEGVVWHAPHLWIDQGLTIDTGDYLARLARYLNLPVVEEKVENLSAFDDADAVVIAAGAGTPAFFLDLPVRVNKGQLAEVPLPEKPHSWIGDGYLARLDESAFFGATYEHTFTSEDPDPHLATEALRRKWENAFPEPWQPLAFKSGLRVAPTHSSLPCLSFRSPNRYVYTGLGSRGLLYHALFAKKLVQGILKDVACLPH